MKIKDLQALEDITTLRTFMESHGIVNATDNELKEVLTTCHNYENGIYTDNISGGMIYRISYDLIEDEVCIEDIEDDVFIEDVNEFIEEMMNLRLDIDICYEDYIDLNYIQVWDKCEEDFKQIYTLNSLQNKVLERSNPDTFTIKYFYNSNEDETRFIECSSQNSCNAEVKRLVKNFIGESNGEKLIDDWFGINLTFKDRFATFLLALSGYNPIKLSSEDSSICIYIDSNVVD